MSLDLMRVKTYSNFFISTHRPGKRDPVHEGSMYVSWVVWSQRDGPLMVNSSEEFVDKRMSLLQGKGTTIVFILFLDIKLSDTRIG